MKKREVRTFQTTEMRVMRAEDDAPKIVGHAAVFNKPTEIGGWFTESVSPGAFKKSIKSDDVRALFNHDANIVLGRNKAGTLKLWEDEDGLGYEVTPPETQWARDLLESIERGDITGSSFGFEVIEEQWTKATDELDHRDLVEVKLWDVSPVTFPQYVEADVAKRTMNEWRDSVGEPRVEEAPPAEEVREETPPAEEPGEEETPPAEEPERSAGTSTEQLKKKLRLRG